MHPRLFELPGGFTITTYGFCLMIGFLSAVWLAMRRASKIGANPDHVLDVSFVALLAGVGGARLMYVVHYWKVSFADQPNKFLAVIDIRSGGLEFLGGLLGAATAILIYMYVTKISIRLYLDVLAPGAMWGLAFGRLGCYFNGCCFGGLCAVPADPAAAKPVWAVQFPYGSLAHTRQWEERKITVPAELVTTSDFRSGLIAGSALAIPVETREARVAAYKSAGKAYEKAKGDGDATESELRGARKRLLAARGALSKDGLRHLVAAMRLPSREVPGRQTSVSEIEALAAKSVTRPIYATQLFSSIHGLLLSFFLSAVFYFRKRQGLVIGLLFLMYPVARVTLEVIRADNPHDVGGLTISQSFSLAMAAGAAVYLILLFKFLPEVSPAYEAELAKRASERAAADEAP